MGDMYRRLEEGRLRAAVRAVENIPRHETMTASRSAQVKKNSIIDIEIEFRELIFCMNLSNRKEGPPPSKRKSRKHLQLLLLLLLILLLITLIEFGEEIVAVVVTCLKILF